MQEGCGEKRGDSQKVGEGWVPVFRVRFLGRSTDITCKFGNFFEMQTVRSHQTLAGPEGVGVEL